MENIVLLITLVLLQISTMLSLPSIYPSVEVPFAAPEPVVIGEYSDFLADDTPPLFGVYVLPKDPVIIERSHIHAEAKFEDTDQGVRLVSEEYLKSDGTPFDEDSFTSHVFGCRRPNPERVKESDVSEVRLLSLATLASTLKPGMPEENVQYFAHRIHLPFTASNWDGYKGNEHAIYWYGDHYQFFLLGEQLDTAYVLIYGSSQQHAWPLQFDLDCTQHMLNTAEEKPQMAYLPVSISAPAEMIQEDLSEIISAAQEDADFAASDEYAMLQFALFSSSLRAQYTMEQVLEAASAFPVLAPEKMVKTEDTLVWPVSRDGFEYLQLFCEFTDGALSHVGFSVDPEAIAGLLALENPDVDMYTVPDKADQPFYKPVVYVSITEAEGAN